MRSIISSILMVAGVSAWAQADAVMVNDTVSDADLAEIRITVKDIGEPSYAPLQLKVMVLCKDNRTNHYGNAPKWTAALAGRPICAWGTHAYNLDKKILALTFSEAAIVVGDAPCETQPAKPLDLKKICERWNK